MLNLSLMMTDNLIDFEINHKVGKEHTGDDSGDNNVGDIR